MQSEKLCRKGQAKKSARGMPWHWEPKKDVANCEKPRGAVNERYIRGYPNGETRMSHTHTTYAE